MKIKHKKIEAGDVFKTNDGLVVKVLRHVDSSSTIVEFDDGTKYITSVRAHHLRSGNVKNPYYPVICGVGFFGVGDYPAYKDGRSTTDYKRWTHMMKRCYDDDTKAAQPTYADCTVDPHWHNFQNFAKWFNSQYKEDGWQLDKDILVDGNKIYSESTCMIIPKEANTLFTLRERYRGDLPLGVIKNYNRYAVYINKYGKSVYMGSFENSKLAFEKFKLEKIAYAKEIASRYRDKLGERFYNGLIAKAENLKPF